MVNFVDWYYCVGYICLYVRVCVFGRLDFRSDGLRKVERRNDMVEQMDATAYYNRGNSKREVDDYKGAIEDYDKAIELNPKFANAYNSRAIAKIFLGDYKGAFEDYNKVEELSGTKMAEKPVSLEVVTQKEIQLCIECIRRKLAGGGNPLSGVDITSFYDDGCKNNNHQFVSIPTQEKVR